MKKVAVILSGCGVFDGSEIQESIATLLALDKAGVIYQCLAPNIPQTRVMNHLTQEPEPQTSRNVLVEAARIARGKIQDLALASADDFDAAIYPGGFGAALNLCNFGVTGADHHVQAEVLKFAKAMAEASKPQGFICIAPALIAKIYGPGVKMTIGSDPQTIATFEAMGNQHHTATAADIVTDPAHKVVSTPAYMTAKRIHEIFEGIEKLVNQVIQLM